MSQRAKFACSQEALLLPGICAPARHWLATEPLTIHAVQPPQIFGWHVPCCDKTNAYWRGSMFTGVARMECKALATQMALLRWQMHQQPWAGRPDQAGAISPLPGGATVSSALDVLQPSMAVQASAVGSETGPQGGAEQLDSPQHQPHDVPSEMVRDRRSWSMARWHRGSEVTAESYGGLSVKRQPAPPLPSLAQLRAQRAADQRLRDQLRGTMVLRCAGAASRCPLRQLHVAGCYGRSGRMFNCE